MHWKDAFGALAELKGKFLHAEPSKRQKALEDIGLKSNRHPLSLGMGLVPHGRGEKEQVDWSVLITVQRRPGDATTPAVATAMSSVLAKLNVRNPIFKQSPPFIALMGGDRGAGEFLRQVRRPPSPGVQIAASDNHPGALCCFARRKGEDAIFGITAWHVATGCGQMGDGTTVFQPRRSGVHGSYPLGRLASVGRDFDVAAIRLEDLKIDDVLTRTLIGSSGNFRLHDPAEVEVDASPEVAKLGPSGGRTIGQVRCREFGVVIENSMEAPQQSWVVESGILVSGFGEAFARKGDSGAPVFDPETRNLLGMVVCGNRDKRSYGDSVFVEINRVLAAIEMESVL